MSGSQLRALSAPRLRLQGPSRPGGQLGKGVLGGAEVRVVCRGGWRTCRVSRWDWAKPRGQGGLLTTGLCRRDLGSISFGPSLYRWGN